MNVHICDTENFDNGCFPFYKILEKFHTKSERVAEEIF
jgi:hypothetical protein